MSTKARLYSMIDELLEDTPTEAERLLDSLHDPVQRVHESAPFDDEPETAEERAGVEEAWADIRNGTTVSHEEARRILFGEQ